MGARGVGIRAEGGGVEGFEGVLDLEVPLLDPDSPASTLPTATLQYSGTSLIRTDPPPQGPTKGRYA